MLEELQMITGSNSNDINYLYYLIIKGGTYLDRFDLIESAKYDTVSVDQSLEEWFNEL
jgi:hypothetical protein